MNTMTLRGAAEYLGTSKNRIWRAVKDGHLPAEEGRYKGQKAWVVSKPDALKWAEEWMTPEERGTIEHLEAPLETTRKGLEAPPEHLGVPSGTSERSDGVFSGTSRSLQDDLVAALERSHRELIFAERRSVELELQLRQSQRLLSENAESIQEREAQAKQVEAQLKVVEDAKEVEIERLNAELESTRQQLVEATTKKPSGFFSWLGLRKKRAAPTIESVNKAV